MNTTDNQPSYENTRLIIFQQHGSGEVKISGIKQYGRNITIAAVFNIDTTLPEIIDNPQEYINDNFSGDIVLSFLKHPDLIDHLITICDKKKIPVIAAGKKNRGAITPFTCCGLGQYKNLADYGSQFGFPEFAIELQGDKISKIKVIRGASCGATWQAAKKVIGLTIDQAAIIMGRETQYLCCADPSDFDPISGKSAVHYAGHVHSAALKKSYTKVKQ